MRMSRKEGKNIPMVATTEPQKPATRKSRSFSQPVCCTRPFSRKGTMTRPLPKVSDPALRKNANSLPSIDPSPAGAVPAAAMGAAAKERSVVEHAHDPAADEEQGDLRAERHRDDEGRGGQTPF